MLSCTSIAVIFWSFVSLVYGQESIRCYDCNSGPTSFGSDICPVTGNLKAELLTTVRCAERCFCRTFQGKPGVVQRGCSKGLGFLLSRPLPEDGCVQDPSENWWCFCKENFCNTDDMRKFVSPSGPDLDQTERPVEKPQEPPSEERFEQPPRKAQETREQAVQPEKPEQPVHPEQPEKPVQPEQPIDKDQQPGDHYEYEYEQSEEYDEQRFEINPEQRQEQPTETPRTDPQPGEELDQPTETPRGPEPGPQHPTEIPFERHYTRHNHDKLPSQWGDSRQFPGKRENRFSNPLDRQPLANP